MSIWYKIKGFESYEITKCGRIRRGKQEKSLWLCRNGYLYVDLWKGNSVTKMALHRILALVFLPPPETPEHCYVAHNDGDKLNNTLENLRWATPAENVDDKRKHGTHSMGAQNPQAKLDEAKIHTIKNKIAKPGVTQKQIAGEFGVSRQTISDIITGKTWGHV